MSEAKARRNDPDTSWEAAETVNVPRDKRAVLSALWNINAGTDEDICEEAHRMEEYEFCTPQSLRSRRAELMRDGYIEQAVDWKGDLMFGMTERRRKCRVFMLTSKGRGLARYAVHCY